MNIAVECRAMDGAPYCGDQTGIWQDNSGQRAVQCICCMVDGLGHGLHARQAACKIIQYVADHRHETPEQLFRGCDAAMRHERGGVMAVAWVEGDRLSYASVGNIAGYLAHHAGDVWRLEHLNTDRGMISGGFRQLNVQRLTLAAGDLLIMHSDGLHPFYQMDGWLPALAGPQSLAISLIEDQGKATDDACVLVYQHPEAGHGA